MRIRRIEKLIKMKIKNFLDVPLEKLNIHGGKGMCLHNTLYTSDDFEVSIIFLNYTVIPCGGSFGIHTHENDNEIYIVLEGTGVYFCNGEKVSVRSGDILINPIGGTHYLENSIDSEMRLLVFAVSQIEN